MVMGKGGVGKTTIAAAIAVALARRGNPSLAAGHSRSPPLQQRALNEHPLIEDVANRHAIRYAVVGLEPQEPVGAARLQALLNTANEDRDERAIAAN
jgi:Mrp family chromosome partitioning ATPase